MSAAAVLTHPNTSKAVVGVNAIAAGYNVGTTFFTGNSWFLAIAAFNVIAASLYMLSYQRLADTRQRAALAESACELTVEELERSLEGAWAALSRTVNQPRVGDNKLATDRVEAFTYCPFCGKQAVHSMRAARQRPDDYDDWYTPIWWGFYSAPQPPKLRLRDEFKFEIVRTCECGAEWGQS